MNRLDEVEPLWEAMHEHHVGLLLSGGCSVRMRSPQEAWRRRRAEFASWMAGCQGWLWIADNDHSPIGFAFVRVHDGDWTYETEGAVGELEALSVEPKMRRWGIGSLLLEEVDRHLSASGVGVIGLRVLAGNQDALRLYGRWGILPAEVRCLGRTQPPRG